MVKIVWSEPALEDLDRIADYIALQDLAAAQRLVATVLERVAMLAKFPAMGSHPPELKGSRYRQLIEPPCRIFYRVDGPHVFILHILRDERRLRPSALRKR